MKRACLFVSAVTVFAIACGGGSAPMTPSRAAVGSPAGIITVSTSSAQALFGASAVDFARCLQAVGEPGCLTGARIQTRAVGAAATAPTAPINLTAAVSGGTVTLTWSAPASGDPVTTYVLEAGTSTGAANLANFATGSTTASYVAFAVGTGTYYVRVRAQNSGGTSAASNEVVVTVGPSGCTSAPNAPSGLAGSVSGSTVTLTWSAPSGGCAATSYVLQAGLSSGGSNLANASTGGVGTTYVATGVANGTYYVRVRTQNAGGQSAASNEVVVTVGTTTVTTTDVQPRSINLGTIDECVGGTLTGTITVTAPANVTWTVNALGSDYFNTPGGTGTVTPASGVGSGTVTVTITRPSRRPIAWCNSTVFNYGDSITIFFSGGNLWITSNLTYKFISVL